MEIAQTLRLFVVSNPVSNGRSTKLVIFVEYFS
jgi:hypothetical protein